MRSAESIERLSPPQKLRLAGEIMAAYSRVRWALRRHHLEAIVARMRAERPRTTEPPPGAPVVQQLSGAVMGLLAVLPTDSRCLVRSLVYLALLERRGIDGTLVIGVRTEPEFAAHAWVELDGEPMLPSGDGEYSPLTVI